MPTKALKYFFQAAFGVTLLTGLAACGDKPPSDIKPQAAIEAIQSNDAAAWNAVRSQKVRWTGNVLKVTMIHGDDFIKEYYLRFDPGFGEGAIAEVPISASEADLYKTGQSVTVTAPVLSYEKEKQTTVVKLGSGKVE